MKTEQEAIAKLIREVNSVETQQTIVPRRIFLLFGIVMALGAVLLVFAVKYGRRDRPAKRDGAR